MQWGCFRAGVGRGGMPDNRRIITLKYITGGPTGRRRHEVLQRGCILRRQEGVRQTRSRDWLPFFCTNRTHSFYYPQQRGIAIIGNGCHQCHQLKRRDRQAALPGERCRQCLWGGLHRQGQW